MSSSFGFRMSLAKIQARNAGLSWSSGKKLLVLMLSPSFSATYIKMMAPDKNVTYELRYSSLLTT